MNDFEPRQAAKSSDVSRPVTTTNDSDFTLSIEEALELYTHAGLPRTPRSIQRYCALGHLESRRVDTPFGQKWLITPQSVSRHIAYIKEVTPATSHDVSRPAATSRDDNEPEISARQSPATGTEVSRPAATTPDSDKAQFVALLERENSFLREQVGVKDKQIAELSELYRGTHVLTQGLQRLLAPLIGAREQKGPPAADRADMSHDSAGL